MIVSFIIPFYGSVRLLKRCLDSIAAQTDGDFEAIVVDDRSPEDGEALARGFGEWCRYVRQPVNSSSYQARERGVREARGEYVVPVDPDDYVLPGLVGEIRRESELSHADVIVYNLRQFCDDGERPHWCQYPPGRYGPMAALEMMAGKRLQWNICAKAIRRQVWLAASGRMPFARNAYINASDDFCAVIPIVLASSVISVIGFDGYRYYENPDSTTHAVLGFGRLVKTLRETTRAWRLVRRFIAESEPPVSRRAKRIADRIYGMIARWWIGEYRAAHRRS